MKLRIELKWAFIFMIMMLLWMVMEKLTGLHDEHIAIHPVVSNFVAIPAILVYVLALLDKRRNFYDGYMTYGQGFICGFWMTIFVTILSPLTQLITSELITPEYFPNVIKYTVENKLMSQTQAESYFNLKSYLFQTIMFTPVMGIFTTLIVALFTMKRRKGQIG